MYFAFRETEVFIIVDLPDAASAAAGGARVSTTPLMMAEVVDAAAGGFLSQVEKQSKLIGSTGLADAEQALRTFVDPNTGKMPNADYQPFGNASQQMSDETNGNVGLMTNYPNPFNPTTLIHYDVPRESHITLQVYNVLGQELKTLVNSEQTAGRYQVMMDGSRMASGVYFFRFQAGSFVETRKLLLIR